MENEFKAINNRWGAQKGDVEVGLLGRHKLYYRVGDKRLLFEREDFGSSENDYGCEIFLSREKWHWEALHEAEELTDVEHERILSDISAAFHAMGHRVILS